MEERWEGLQWGQGELGWARGTWARRTNTRRRYGKEASEAWWEPFELGQAQGWVLLYAQRWALLWG